ncbi:hypothetical protein Fmac_005781 [Flemingia macrophylla]|uniref:Uncharacterized protein n=1 Tax=Flemingia macrophylla TaxID=520843 RepID=A0ABD1N8Q6_9FABA
MPEGSPRLDRDGNPILDSKGKAILTETLVSNLPTYGLEYYYRESAAPEDLKVPSPPSTEIDSMHVRKIFSATAGIDGFHFIARDITFQNTAGPQRVKRWHSDRGQTSRSSTGAPSWATKTPSWLIRNANFTGDATFTAQLTLSLAMLQ